MKPPAYIHPAWCACSACQARKLRQQQNIRKGLVRGVGTKIALAAAKKTAPFLHQSK